ncbi:MAG: hypothetical protein A3G58_00550 [Candidatus Colwellbacteria bacterium RIFCSPLOWO2_12_FULL_46_17]|uniref:Uncharacterized protein n=3 Tax=Parcubacteria group TaxID=1794811 RepID=A0A0H4T3Z6_9BACT|nr:hypothetical protein [uncultured Parcubacteria bacterium Rifle_16ft_4_minimus_37647]OGY60495.1 MAG: hypothetical protein A3I33_00645 [Candidatus Colwellbacteria bacterium RIFCSPLOWO2_02_FULL_45_11]OGY62313.1 MAG: hypothetical protein A3G58_00550 [Candidatus Colwellbacteria bacterium RIFCSPLOWO2_12_FULL_46_17]
MRLEEFSKLDNDKKLEEVFKSVEKTRKYFRMTFIITLVLIILPLLFMPVVVSQFLGAYDFGTLGL